MRILCVDDDRINTLLMEHVCRAVGGLELAFAETGDDAVELAARWQPRLLIVDLHLPDTDGLALLPRLRAAAGDAALPAVLCTAELRDDALPRARAAGYDDCWAKPVLVDEVRGALQRLAAGAA